MPSKHAQITKFKKKLLHEKMSVTYMAQHLQLDRRSIFRYLKTLRSEEPNLVCLNPTERKHYYKIESSNNLNTQQIKEIEKAHNELVVGGNHRHAKLMENLLESLKGNTNISWKLPEEFELDHGPLAENTDLSKSVTHYVKLIQQNVILKVSYQNTQGILENISLHPQKIILRIGRLYLIALANDEILSLPLSRIKRVVKTSNPSIKIDTKNVYKYTFGQWKPRNLKEKPQKIQISCLKDWVKYLLQEANFYPPLKTSKDIFIVELYITPDFENWLLSLMPDIKVIGPLSLKESLQKRMEKGISLSLS